MVPERREELTTEGGLDVAGLKERLEPILKRLSLARIGVSMFVDPEPRQIEAAAMLGADFVEIHTGVYANFADADLAKAREDHGAKNRLSRVVAHTHSRKTPKSQTVIPSEFSDQTRVELQKIRTAVKLARSLKLKPNAGHGLNYDNVPPIASIPGIAWLHIGHAIVARSLMIGMERAVREMLRVISGLQ